MNIAQTIFAFLQSLLLGIILGLIIMGQLVPNTPVYIAPPTMTPEMSCQGGIFTVTNIPRADVKDKDIFDGMVVFSEPLNNSASGTLEVPKDTSDPQPTNILDGNLSGIWCVGDLLHMDNTHWDANWHVDVGPYTN